jgi:hypothetical protein
MEGQLHLCKIQKKTFENRPKRTKKSLGVPNHLLKPFMVDLGQIIKSLGGFKNSQFPKFKNSKFFCTTYLYYQ